MKVLSVIVATLLATTMHSQTNPVTTQDPIVVGETAENIATSLDDENKIYSGSDVEVKPDFPGGMSKFYKFIAANFNPPDEPGVNGKLAISFVIEKDGSLSDIKVTHDIGHGTGPEILRVLKLSPPWIPGERNGKKIRTLYLMPFVIQTGR